MTEKHHTKCITMGCNKSATTADGYCSDECRKSDYEEELGFQRIQNAIKRS